MNQADNNKEIFRYLLGLSDPEETDRLDELSFTDDEFVARLEGVENDLIDDYLQGALVGSELQQFESYYLASPRRREKVQFAKSLHEFAAQSVATQTVEVERQAASAPTQEKPESFWQFLTNIFTLPNFGLQLGFASAALLILSLGGWFMWENIKKQNNSNALAPADRIALEQRAAELQKQIDDEKKANEQKEEELKAIRQKMDELQKLQDQKTQIADNQPPAIPRALPGPKTFEFELAAQTRGPGQILELKIPAGTDVVLLHLELGSDEYGHYQAELQSPSNEQSLWKSSKLISRLRKGRKFIDARIPAKQLSAPGYLLKLQGVTPTGEVEDLREYALRVTR